MDLTVRPAKDADVPALLELHKAQNEFSGGWFANPHAGGLEARWEDLTPAQRWLHGGPWMDPALLRHHLARLAPGKGTVLVAEGGGRVVGEADLWFSEEPLPWGPYVCVSDLATYPAGDAGAEGALLAAAGREARGRDLSRLDVAPLHAGGDPARLEGLGFRVLAEHRTVHVLHDRRPKDVSYEVASTDPGAGDLASFFPLNHTEPVGFRLGNLGNEWAAGLLKEVSHPFGGILRVGHGTIGVTGRVCTWLPEREAEVDLWVPPATAGNLPWFRAAAGAAVDYVARRFRVVRFRATVPSHLVPALESLGFEDGTDPDPWFRRHVGPSNL